MIPKIIHYIWFSGDPKPPLVNMCIQSWKDKLPDFEIKEWNMSNYDTNKNQFMKEAVLMKKYQFASDYARFDILYNYGGVYFDSDVEVIKDITPLLNDNGFIGVDGNGVIAMETIGAVPNIPIFKKLMALYENEGFIMQNGQMNMIPCPQKCQPVLYGKTQEEIGLTVYPKEYFYPYDFMTKKTRMTDNTYTKHHYAASWMPKWFKTM